MIADAVCSKPKSVPRSGDTAERQNRGAVVSRAVGFARMIVQHDCCTSVTVTTLFWPLSYHPHYFGSLCNTGQAK